MGSPTHMPTPMCLIENQRGKLAVCRDALQRLSQIDQPVVVVAIAGLYRTGKSYLMNKLAGKNSGFPLGSTVQANTKGIWMWCVPYPGRSDQTLVLLDTEGLGDVEKGDTKNDTWIFALAVLLSSTFIYNSIGTIDQQAMDQLQPRVVYDPTSANKPLHCVATLFSQKIVSDKKEEYCEMNRRESRKRCLELLTRLSRELEDGIQEGKYTQPGSYQNFLADQQAVMEQYRKTPGKGVMAEEVLDKFLQDKDIMGKAILQNDKALTEKQREMEEANARAAAAEREQELQKQQLALSQKQMEDQERSFQVNIQELKTKMEHDRKNLLEEQNKMVESKLKEQEKLLNEGFQKQANQLNAHIQQLKEENENIQKPSWFSRITGTLLDVASFIPGPVGIGARIVGAVKNLFF
ncbi:hypothetical protein lerEdw1_009971 [Lerista edwardsae]|nr:hypothetical protein lerEdw1_009971 [Lerista edwardsae]